MTVNPAGELDVFASGLVGVSSVTIDNSGDNLFVSDVNGVYRIRPTDLQGGPTVIMKDPSHPLDGVFTNPSGAPSVRVLFSEPVTFVEGDLSIVNDQDQAVPFSVLGSGSAFMLIGFGQPLVEDTYTVTIADTVLSSATGAQIDSDGDGLAGGVAIIVMEHRNRHDSDNDGDVDLNDYADFASCFAGPNIAVAPNPCDTFDADGDTDVDFKDFVEFQLGLTKKMRSRPRLVAKTVPSVVKSAMAYKGNEAVLLYIADVDDNTQTLDDRELFGVTFDGGCLGQRNPTHK